jgi:release factor glutamine methyltransferase
MCSLAQRHGDNLYPVQFSATFGDHTLDLEVPEGVWKPTPHGVHLGNMLTQLDFSGEHVLELGTGCGVHAILIARAGAPRMTVTEIDQPILDNARHNLEKHGIEIPIDYVVADWIQVDGGPYDCLITNPPFGKAGKHYRRYFIDTLIIEAHKLVRPGGRLIFIHSSMADIPRSLRLMDECGMEVRILGETDHEFRNYYFEDPQYLLEMAKIPGGYQVRDGKQYERLMAFEARLPR